MNKELVFINVCPDDLYFAWQVEVFIENYLRLGFKHEFQVLLYVPPTEDRKGKRNEYFTKLEKRYEKDNIKFFWYPDSGNCLQLIQAFGYLPLLRPYTLYQHFKKYPELKDKAIFYTDQDICFTKYVDFTPFLQDDICYLSDTRGYLDVDYLDSKIKDVRPEKLEEYKLIDVANNLAKFAGLTRETIAANNDKTGGAQYLLKNIDYRFWGTVLDLCCTVWMYLNSINQQYMKGETPIERTNNGFQAWCADMWAVLYHLWATKHITNISKELDFTFKDSPIETWDKVNIFHNSGVRNVKEKLPDGTEIIHNLFQKSGPNEAYVRNLTTPYNEDFSYVSPKYTSYLYTKEIEFVKNKYNY